MRIELPIQITWQDYPTSEDHALLVYSIGCEHGCKNCHNTILKTGKNIIDLSVNELYERLLQMSDKEKTKKIVFSGGDPLYKNLESIKEFLSINKDFDVCIYTGYDIEYVKQNNVVGFSFLKCGKYDEKLKQSSGKNDDYIKLASINQNFYDADFNQLSENGALYFNKESINV